jgi:hypothetical protein
MALSGTSVGFIGSVKMKYQLLQLEARGWKAFRSRCRLLAVVIAIVWYCRLALFARFGTWKTTVRIISQQGMKIPAAAARFHRRCALGPWSDS